MKLAAILATLLLTACASGPSPQKIEHDRYVAQNRPLALSGAMKWTVYYDGLYSRMLAAGAPSYALNPIISLMDSAEQLEAGKITEAEFQQKRRIAQAENQQGFENAQRQEQAAYNQRQAIGAAQTAAGLAMIQASQPQPYMLPVQAPVPQTGNAYVTGYIKSQSVNGSLKYCNYSNGAVLTVASYALCPNSTR